MCLLTVYEQLIDRATQTFLNSLRYLRWHWLIEYTSYAGLRTAGGNLVGCLQRRDRFAPQEWHFLLLLAQQVYCCEATVVDHYTTMAAQVLISSPNRPEYKNNNCCFNIYAHVSTFQHWFCFGSRSTKAVLEAAVILMSKYYSNCAGLDLNTVAVLSACFNPQEVIRINCRINCGSSTWRDGSPLWFPCHAGFPPQSGSVAVRHKNKKNFFSRLHLVLDVRRRLLRAPLLLWLVLVHVTAIPHSFQTSSLLSVDEINSFGFGLSHSSILWYCSMCD